MMLIMLVFLLGIAATAYLMHALNQANIRTARSMKTAAALAQAKAALLGYAAAYDDLHPEKGFGYLPCPDTSATDTKGEGSQSPCDGQDISVLGRLPWKTLKVSPLRDGHGECLWYAVSGTYKNNPKTAGKLTPLVPGLLQVLAADGSTYLAGPADPAVAVIFAAGPPLADQDRTGASSTVNCGGNYAASNYLDTDLVTATNNAAVSALPHGVSTFIAAWDAPLSTNNAGHFNDKLLIIKRGELFAAYCKSNAQILLAQIAGADNGCKAGGISKAVCSTAAEQLQNYCAPQSCKDAAQAFVVSPCLGNLTPPSCQAAIAGLKACHA